MHAVIFSHMSYCVTVWSQAHLSKIKPIASLYNQALKIMDKKSYEMALLSHTSNGSLNVCKT